MRAPAEYNRVVSSAPSFCWGTGIAVCTSLGVRVGVTGGRARNVVVVVLEG